MYFYANPILIAAAVIPAIILLGKVEKADRLEKESRRLLVSLVLFGIVATFFASMGEQLGMAVLSRIFPEGGLVFNILLYFGVVAFSEEGAKYVLLKRKTWNNPEFNCQFDGVVYSVFVSLGFALWENIGYVAMYGLSTALVRAVTAVPGHACFGVFMGTWYGMAKRREGAGDDPGAARLRKNALLIPALLHGFYDFAATYQDTWMGLVFLVFVVAMFVTAVRLVRRVSANDVYIDPNRFGFWN
ncbi:MAG: PrsW family intramembrane metalloprotease [Oscillospiraceae bacterium]|nr:PrsW family intramembrane metalloprotease [Oscillospiraceae bacterium]